jgi:hypothetical protein
MNSGEEATTANKSKSMAGGCSELTEGAQVDGSASGGSSLEKQQPGSLKGIVQAFLAENEKTIRKKLLGQPQEPGSSTASILRSIIGSGQGPKNGEHGHNMHHGHMREEQNDEDEDGVQTQNVRTGSTSSTSYRHNPPSAGDVPYYARSYNPAPHLETLSALRNNNANEGPATRSNNPNNDHRTGTTDDEFDDMDGKSPDELVAHLSDLLKQISDFESENSALQRGIRRKHKLLGSAQKRSLDETHARVLTLMLWDICDGRLRQHYMASTTAYSPSAIGVIVPQSLFV